MYPRYLLSFAPASAVTLGLLLLMQSMIAVDVVRLAQRPPRLVDFVDVARRPPAPETRTIPRDPPQVIDPPTLPKTGPDIEVGRIRVETRRTEPTIRSDKIVGGRLVDGEMLPIVKVAPVYPARAIARELEGYVIVEFTVTGTGRVRDVKVVESTHPVFDKAAIDAALKFKYRPRVIDGRSVDVHGVRNLLRFVLEK